LRIGINVIEIVKTDLLVVAAAEGKVPSLEREGLV